MIIDGQSMTQIFVIIHITDYQYQSMGIDEVRDHPSLIID